MLMDSDAFISVRSTLISDVGEVDGRLGLSLHDFDTVRRFRCARRSDIIK